MKRVLKVKEIHFNFDPLSAGVDALTVRRSGRAGSVIRAPEWRAGSTPLPVVYAIGALTGNVRIRVRFKDGPPSSVLNIRSVVADPGTGSTLLGRIAPVDVAFDSAGESGLEEVELVDSRLSDAGVGRHQIEWRWQMEQGVAGWTDFDVTTHRVYTLLDTPGPPWRQSPPDEDDIHLPWISALKFACVWARGAKTSSEVNARITDSVNRHPLLAYTTKTNFGDIEYCLTDFLTQLRGERSFRLNCVDCANAVRAFANLVGSRLKTGLIGAVALSTKWVVPIGGDPRSASDWVETEWGFHEVAWARTFAPDGLVCDACLLLDVSLAGRTSHIPWLAVEMTFDASGEEDYKGRLFKTPASLKEETARPLR
jgi:hypothetical protein